ncbi:hypothetical protein TNCV_1072091 [Trichonephila clavipes]|nr:hypothetical protein TNCV_1072091 [Trichonephila clavipes]
MGVTLIKDRFNRIKSGRKSVECDQRIRRPQTARNAAVIEKVENIVMKDCRLTVRETSNKLECDQRIRRPQTARNAAVIEKVENIVMKDCRLTVRETSNKLRSVQVLQVHFGVIMQRSSAKFVPKLLSVDQKNSVLQLHQRRSYRRINDTGPKTRKQNIVIC